MITSSSIRPLISESEQYLSPTATAHESRKQIERVGLGFGVGVGTLLGVCCRGDPQADGLGLGLVLRARSIFTIVCLGDDCFLGDVSGVWGMLFEHGIFV
eukprot:95251-Amorphochlora_amoeboformis.AAC.2